MSVAAALLCAVAGVSFVLFSAGPGVVYAQDLDLESMLESDGGADDTDLSVAESEEKYEPQAAETAAEASVDEPEQSTDLTGDELDATQDEELRQNAEADTENVDEPEESSDPEMDEQVQTPVEDPAGTPEAAAENAEGLAQVPATQEDGSLLNEDAAESPLDTDPEDAVATEPAAGDESLLDELEQQPAIDSATQAPATELEAPPAETAEVPVEEKLDEDASLLDELDADVGAAGGVAASSADATADTSQDDSGDSLLDALESDAPAAAGTGAIDLATDLEATGSTAADRGAEGGSLLDQLESDAPLLGAGPDAALSASDADMFSEGITDKVFRQERLMDIDISRLRFSLADLYNGILIKRLPKGVDGSPSLSGYTGLYRTITAEKKDKYSFRFGAHTSFYYMGELWDGVSQAHLDAIGFFTFSILPELEARIGANASGHHSGMSGRFSNEPLYQILGDLDLGAKYVYEFFPWLSALGVWDLRFYTNVGRFGIRWDAFSTQWTVGATIDWREFPYYRFPFPWRAHINLGYFVNQSKELATEIDEINASSYYGLGLVSGDQLLMRFALDYPEDPLDYYIEYTTEQIVNQRDAGVRVNKWSQSPSRFTFGIRYNPYENIILDGAFDMSWGLQQSIKVFGILQPPSNPYALNFGLTYEWNPRGWAIFDLRGLIRGIVVDADTGEPVGGAIVEYVDNDKDSYQAANTGTGEFVSYRLPPGRVTIKIRKEDYEPTLIEPEVYARKTIEEKIFLRKVRQVTDNVVGVLVGQVLDSQNRPLAAVLEFSDRGVGDVYSSADDGSFIRILQPGTYSVRVTAAGYEAKNYDIPIEAKKKTRILFKLITGDEVGALAGAVVDDQGQPLSAKINFLDAKIDPVLADATGKFMRVLPSGIYKIQVELAGYSSKMLELPVQAGRKTTLEIKLEPQKAEGAMAGRVLSNMERPLAAVITFDDPRISPVPTDPDTGSYLKILMPGTYDISVQAPGYETKKFQIPVLRDKKTVQDFVLRGVQELGQRLARLEGDRIVLVEPVSFEPGSSLLTEKAYLVLNDVARIMLQLPNDQVTILVHTNNLGPSKANLVLSQGRADAIKEYLKSLGLPESMLDGKGFGEEQPLVENDTPANRAKNERVEFLVRKGVFVE